MKEAGRSSSAPERILDVLPVGEALTIGRVVNALGLAIDGKGPIDTPHRRRVEVRAPGILARQPAYAKSRCRPGSSAIDSMVPIGRGQRELIIGDHAKPARPRSRLRYDPQPEGSERYGTVFTSRSVKSGRRSRASWTNSRSSAPMQYTTVVVAGASEMAPLQFIAPYSGVTMAEYFRDSGRHTLCIYDDLSKQAVAYRQLSQLLRRPRAAKPTLATFSTFTPRLLSSAPRMADEYVIVKKDVSGFGTDAATPTSTRATSESTTPRPSSRRRARTTSFFQTLARAARSPLYPSSRRRPATSARTSRRTSFRSRMGRSSSRPTSLLLVVRPAINVGISVSRVGGSAQIKAMKAIAGKMKLELAQYRENGRVRSVRRRPGQGNARPAQARARARLVEILKQGQYVPISVEKQIVIIYAGTLAATSTTSSQLGEIGAYEKGLFDFIEKKYGTIYETLRTKKVLDEATEEILKKALDEFAAAFGSSSASPTTGNN